MAWRYQRAAPYSPGQAAAYKISRSKIDLFVQCPRCFWLDVRLGIKRPSGPPFTINSAIDTLLKKEFDSHRVAQTKHPLSEAYGLDLVPFKHEKMEEWRDALRRGVTFLHPGTNLRIGGGIDDIWIDLNTNEVAVVDYKATAKAGEVTLDAEWQNMYKRQMEIYQWLMRRNDFKVSNTGYFVYTNVRLDLAGFNDRLEFKTKIIPYIGNDSWVEPTIIKMKKSMDSNKIPEVGKRAMDASKDCEYCTYAKSRTALTLEAIKK